MALVEEMLAAIYGLDQEGEVVRVWVYRQNKNVRLSGPLRSHIVHPSNKRDIEGWRREAARMWGLTDIVEFEPNLFHSELKNEIIEDLSAKSAERKRAARQ